MSEIHSFVLSGFIRSWAHITIPPLFYKVKSISGLFNTDHTNYAVHAVMELWAKAHWLTTLVGSFDVLIGINIIKLIQNWIQDSEIETGIWNLILKGIVWIPKSKTQPLRYEWKENCSIIKISPPWRSEGLNGWQILFNNTIESKTQDLATTTTEAIINVFVSNNCF